MQTTSTDLLKSFSKSIEKGIDMADMLLSVYNLIASFICHF